MRRVSLFVLVLCGTVWAQTETAVDRYQRRINREAYRNRFNRTPIPEEITGIQVAPEEGSSPQETPNYKMVLMTGDDSIRAFDNARKKLFEIFTNFGVTTAIQLSRKQSEQINGVRPTSVANLSKALDDLNVGDGDACLVHMTSHGSPSGFYIRGQNYLTPSALDQMVDASCGQNPTVLLISACYSGIFAEPSMQAPNRVILTAARKDKTSFGCSAEAVYTYWDGCLIDTLPKASTWFELAGLVEECIERKESAGGFDRSYPQARFGANVKDLAIR